MECIGIGIDVSKGRADIAIINQSGTLLTGSGGYDDTHDGQQRLSGVLRDLRTRYPEARLLAGVEATAGFERNWIAFFKRERQAGRQVVVHRLNPLAVKRFLDADLHRKVDDRQAAAGIARFLLEYRREVEPDEVTLDGKQVFYRQIRSLITMRTTQRQQLQSLLPSANPELVQYIRDGVPNWVLAVCAQYPTATHLARCQVKALAAIPHVGATKAESLRTAAKSSTASLTDDGTAAAIRMIIVEIQALDARIATGQAELEKLLGDDPRVALLDSIPGVGIWSAMALTLEIGDPDRFADVRQLIAWSGLDPREDTSGDGVIKRGISHRGNAHLRAILFPLARGMLIHNPCIGDFIRKKINEGKPTKVAIVAGCAKLLRIVYALLATKKPYNPQHEATRAKPAAADRQTARAATPATIPESANDLHAPVSSKEARKRRKMALQENNAPAPRDAKCEVMPHAGPGAGASAASTPQGSCQATV